MQCCHMMSIKYFASFPLVLAFVICGVIWELSENTLRLDMPGTLAMWAVWSDPAQAFFCNSQVFLLFKRWLLRQVLHFPWEILLNLLLVSLGKELCCRAVALSFGDAILKSGVTNRNVFLWDDGRVVRGLVLFRSSMLFFLFVLGRAQLLLQYWEP